MTASNFASGAAESKELYFVSQHQLDHCSHLLFRKYDGPGLSLAEYRRDGPGLGLTTKNPTSQSYMAAIPGLPACSFCVKVFPETDMTEDLKKIEVPTLILHGDDDQIVPMAAPTLLAAKLVKNAKLTIYEGASHGMCTTEKDKVNAGLVAFVAS